MNTSFNEIDVAYLEYSCPLSTADGAYSRRRGLLEFNPVSGYKP
jgi:hypothetical protein